MIYNYMYIYIYIHICNLDGLCVYIYSLHIMVYIWFIYGLYMVYVWLCNDPIHRMDIPWDGF